MSDAEIIADALQKHPECKFVRIIPSLEDDLTLTRVALVWPDEMSAHGPPKFRLNGYTPYDEPGKRICLPLRVGFELPFE
jgi:hypothetical protein